MNEPLPEERRAVYLHHCVSVIDSCGWMVQVVLPTEASPWTTFAYTVGLTPHGFPELAMAGLPAEEMQAILNDLARPVFDANRRYSHGEVLDDVLSGGYKVTVVEGPYSRDDIWPGTARSLYGEDAVRLQQVCWPDGQNRFPWDGGYSIPPWQQPLIGRPPDVRGSR